MRRALYIALCCTACSALGGDGQDPDGLPHGGTGQFRLLDREEVGVFGPPPGRALVIIDDAVESAFAIERQVFYTTAPLSDMPPMLPMDHPGNEIFWPAFGPRRIHLGTSRDEGVGAFDRGDEIFMSRETWEGGEVFDPWVVRDRSTDTVRLYYAGQGGIGVAEAPSVEGPLARPLDRRDPRIAGARRPSVVRGPDGRWLMYYDTGSGIEVAVSDDGVSFEPMGPITLNGEDLGEGTELRVASPGALRVDTAAERVLVRLYFESIREGILETGDAHVFYVAGSEDGFTFERHPRPVAEQTDIRFPSPLLLDDRVTLLYGNLPHTGGPFFTRALVVAVSPAGQRFDPMEEE